MSSNEPPVKKKRGRKPKNKDHTINETTEIKKDLSTPSEEPVVNIPKKRGRKPKNKDLTINTEPKILQKRGRKPKKKDPNEPPKIPKKRGRKPKDKTVIPVTNNINTESDNIIIHLPINTATIKKNMDDELLTYNPDIKEPLPYENYNIESYQFISQKNNPNNKELTGEGPDPSTEYCAYPFDEKQKSIFEVLDDETDDRSDETINNINKLDEEYEVNHIESWYSNNNNNNKELVSIMGHIKQQREVDKDNFSCKLNKHNVEKCLIQFNESNKTQKWPSSTTIYCWWCCHSFEGHPCALPCDFKDNIFKVFGIFCSPECAAAYNFDDIHTGYDLWERYSLLNFLYRKIYNDNNIKIKIAPPKQTLKIFGGHLTINEYRINNTNYNNTYKLIIPPMISIIPVQELTNIDKGYTSIHDKKYFIDKDKLTESSTLRLKRSKPFNSNKNTLEKCMLLSNTLSTGSDKISNTDFDSNLTY
jgi:hypothetical protein